MATASILYFLSSQTECKSPVIGNTFLELPANAPKREGRDAIRITTLNQLGTLLELTGGTSDRYGEAT